MRFDEKNTAKEIVDIRNQFKDFAVNDYDDSYIVLIRGKELPKSFKDTSSVTARISRGSLGDYSVSFVINKPGERGKLFSGKDAIKRIRKYLGDN